MSEQITFGFDLPPSSGRSTPTSFLLDAVRRRDSGSQALSALTVLLFLGGSLLFMWPILTDIYSGEVIQERAAEEFENFTQELNTLADWEQQVVGNDGVALTKIVIDRIDLQTLVVEGTSPSALRAGAGHYGDTPLPGQNGNVAIAGHRTTYGKPFNRLDELQVGDDIWLITPIGDYRYTVSDELPSEDCEPTSAAACVTVPSDWRVIDAPADMTQHLLTLTTCHPKGSAARRLVIRASLAEALPPGTYDGKNSASDG